jgi:hypothetical protein
MPHCRIRSLFCSHLLARAEVLSHRMQHHRDYMGAQTHLGSPEQEGTPGCLDMSVSPQGGNRGPAPSSQLWSLLLQRTYKRHCALTHRPLGPHRHTCRSPHPNQWKVKVRKSRLASKAEHMLILLRGSERSWPCNVKIGTKLTGHRGRAIRTHEPDLAHWEKRRWEALRQTAYRVEDSSKPKVHQGRGLAHQD